MAYYDALIAAWSSGASLPQGVTGTAFAQGDTTAQKLAKINAWTVSGASAPVPVIDITTWLRTRGLWLPIKAAAGTAASLGAVAAVDYNEDPRTERLDFGLAAVQAMVADLVTHSLLTQDQAAAMVALGATTLPWWQANGYAAPISSADISLSGIDGSVWQIVVGSPSIDPQNSNIFTNVAFQNKGATVFSRATFGNLSTASVQTWAMAVLQAYLNNLASIQTLPTTAISVTD